ncbi:MAG: sialate O-acetylesterase [Bacteroidales bacterium]|jgi:hypothetical protein|nr:sialate O-acetylesterase [Bacteroidales bacterium]
MKKLLGIISILSFTGCLWAVSYLASCGDKLPVAVQDSTEETDTDSTTDTASDLGQAVAKEKFHLYLLIGQSNMAGRGTVEPQDTVGNPRILKLNRNGEWEIAREPLHFDKPVAGVGPGLAFARDMLPENSEVLIGLIPCAAGGSGITVWKPGAYWEQTNSYPYDDALKRTHRALEDGTLKGILWHQGEADQSPQKTAAYRERLIALVAALRKEFNTSDVPFLAGELPHFRENRDAFNKILHDAKQDIPFYDVVSAEGLTPRADMVHIDAVSQRTFGKRYAQKMKALQKSAEQKMFMKGTGMRLFYRPTGTDVKETMTSCPSISCSLPDIESGSGVTQFIK